MGAFDWSATPLRRANPGRRHARVAVDICLNSRLPMFVWWGPQLINIYNDGYAPVLGKRHPDALGQPARNIWADIWPQIAEDVERSHRPRRTDHQGAHVAFDGVATVTPRRRFSRIRTVRYPTASVGSADCSRSARTKPPACVHERERTAELVEANEKFQAVYDQGLFAGLIDLQGRLIDANQSSLVQCGFMREDVIGKLFWECGWWNRSPEIQAWVRHAYEQAQRRPVSRRVTILHRRWIGTLGQFCHDANSKRRG